MNSSSDRFAVSRRTAIKGALGAGVAIILPISAASCSNTAPTPTQGTGPDGSPGELVQPQSRIASGGVLATSLVCRGAEVRIAGETLQTVTYEGQVPGPTLRLNPGDVLKLTVDNQLEASGGGMGSGNGRGMMGSVGAATNLHTHGLHVSPAGVSDNVFLQIAPGESQDYVIEIPEDHWGGLNWYHPHKHGTVSVQVLGGMAGAIVISGPLDEVPEVKAAAAHVLVLQRIQTGPPMIARMASMHDNRFLSLNGWDTQFTTNGTVNPTLTMRPGEVQRWRIVNADAIDYFDLALVDAQGKALKDGLKFLARDGITLPKLEARDSQIMVPGNRFEILVQAPNEPGQFTLTGRTADGFGQPDIGFLTVNVSGDPIQMGLPTGLPSQLEPIADKEVTVKKTVKYGSWSNSMVVNGESFQDGPNEMDLELDSVAEWTVQNLSDQDHAFHIHTNPFYVVAENEVPVTTPAFYDTYPIPPAISQDTPGSITVRMRPERFTGKIVQHCHILPHEDAGMMGVVHLK
jgi:FtsP/CotA-like multicopper oxidase with cupredoxin domain